jgi:hypothetical protein
MVKNSRNDKCWGTAWRGGCLFKHTYYFKLDRIQLFLLDDYLVEVSKGGSSIVAAQASLVVCPCPTCNVYISQHTPVAQLFLRQTLAIGLLHLITS